MSAVIADSVSPARSRRVRSTCSAKIAVAEAEPGLAAQRTDRLHERPGLVAPAPAGRRIVEAGQRIDQRVDIGRDGQAEMLEIVAGVGDDQQIVRRQHAAQAQRQLGAADAAGQRNDRPLLIGTYPPSPAASARRPALAGADQAGRAPAPPAAPRRLAHQQRCRRGDLVGEAR